MKKKPIIVGFDPGNSWTSLVAMNDERREVTMPSYVGRGDISDLIRIRGGAADTAIASDEFGLEHDGLQYYVGNLAVRESTATSLRGDVMRYWNGHTLRLMLTALGSVTTGDVRCRVVTGMPVSCWDAGRAQEVRQSLMGSHEFILNGQRHSVNVEGVMCIMEGAGALILHGNGKTPQGVIDVGERTTDLVFAQGQRPVKNKSDGREIGIGQAADTLSNLVKRAYGRHLSTEECFNVLSAYIQNKNIPDVHVNGEIIDLQKHCQTAVRAVGQEVLSFVSTLWRSSDRNGIASNAQRVWLVGGGAHYVHDILRPHIPHLVVPDRPEMANVDGYLKLGLMIPEERWHVASS